MNNVEKTPTSNPTPHTHAGVEKTSVIHTHVVEGLDSTNNQNALTRVHMYTYTRVHIHVYVYVYTYSSALDDLAPIFEQLRVFLRNTHCRRSCEPDETRARAAGNS